MMEDCQKKAAGKPKTAQSPRASEPKGTGKKAKVANGRRERRPLMNGQMVKKNSRLVRNPVRRLQVCSRVLSTDVTSTTDVTGKPGNGSRNRLDDSGNPTRLDTWMRILLTHSGMNTGGAHELKKWSMTSELKQ